MRAEGRQRAERVWTDEFPRCWMGFHYKFGSDRETLSTDNTLEYIEKIKGLVNNPTLSYVDERGCRGENFLKLSCVKPSNKSFYGEFSEKLVTRDYFGRTHRELTWRLERGLIRVNFVLWLSSSLDARATIFLRWNLAIQLMLESWTLDTERWCHERWA